EEMEAESQKRLEEERTNTQTKIDAEYKRLESFEKSLRDKQAHEESRLKTHAEDSLRARQEDLENKFIEERRRLEKEYFDKQERLAADQQTWIQERDRRAIELDNQRLVVEDLKAGLE